MQKFMACLSLSVQPNKKTLNIEKIDTLQSLYIACYKSKNEKSANILFK